MLIFLHIGVLHHHHLEKYTYYFKETNFTFQILEKNKYDVLILGDCDSIYFQAPYYGEYLGIDFFVSKDSNIVYLGPGFPTIYNKVNKKYKLKSIKQTLEEEDPCAQYTNVDYWYFCGGCDQGRYTFTVMRGKKVYGSLEPLEWK